MNMSQSNRLVCIHCNGKTLEILHKVPRGRQSYTNQTYLKCSRCRRIQMIMNSYLIDAERPPTTKDELDHLRKTDVIEYLRKFNEYQEWLKAKRKEHVK